MIMLSKAKKMMALRLIARVFFGKKFNWEFESLSLHGKTDGVQLGAVVELTFKSSQTIRYYVKTHQHGTTQYEPGLSIYVDPREVFVYKVKPFRR